MYLGVWWMPWTWGQDFIDGIVSFFYGILLTIDCIIYSFVSYVYQIFLVLAQGADIFDDKIIDGFVNRLYIILGVVMLFIIAYSLLKNMVNPDETLKGKKSPISIVKDVIISVVLIALVPTIFDFAFAFQNSLLINNTIGKIIVGEGGSGTTTDDIRKGGYIMASGVFKAFLHAEHPYCDSKTQENNGVYDDGTECKPLYVDNSETTTYGDLWNEAYDSTTFWALARLGPSIVSGNVSYYILIAPAAGVFVLLVLLNYCLDMALRLVKLAVYELIAPIPLFARMVPNDQAKKVFDNWLKATMSTFAEVFIRIAILYFSVMLISAATSSINNLFSPLVSGSARLDLLLFAQALIIIGIVLFVKQAPEIIKEITGLDSGKFNVLGSAMKSAAMIGGAVTAGVRNWSAATDEDGNPKNGAWNRFKSSLGGAGSAAWRSTWNRDNVKDINSMRTNAHNAAENAIKKRIRRENDKKEMEAYYQNEGQGKQTSGIVKFLGGDTVKYKAHQAGERVKAWAGKDTVDSVTVSRTKELADRLDANYSSLEGTWKKSQAFIDAKAETDKLEKQQLAMQARIDELRRNGENENKIWTIIKQEWGMTKEEIDVKAKNAKAIQKQIEKGEQIKKAESIANAARNIQLATSQYSDIEIDMSRVLERYKPEISDPNLPQKERDKIEDGFKNVMDTYKDLSNPKIYQKLVDDLKSSDDDVRATAIAYIDILDKMNLQARAQKDEAAFAEAQKQSTFAKKDSGGSK